MTNSGSNSKVYKQTLIILFYPPLRSDFFIYITVYITFTLYLRLNFANLPNV